METRQAAFLSGNRTQKDGQGGSRTKSQYFSEVKGPLLELIRSNHGLLFGYDTRISTGKFTGSFIPRLNRKKKFAWRTIRFQQFAVNKSSNAWCTCSQ